MRGSRFFPLSVLGVPLLLSFLLAGTPAWGQAAQVCERALAAAEEQYLDAEYGEALRLVSACLNQDGIPQPQAVSAYRLLALIHLKQDALEQARAAVVNLLGIEPTYTADPVNSPPAYVSLVSIVQRDLAGRLENEATADTAAGTPARAPFFRRTSTWVMIGGVLVGSGVATVLAIGRGGGGDGGGGEPPPTGAGSLPIPPGTP